MNEIQKENCFSFNLRIYRDQLMNIFINQRNLMMKKYEDILDHLHYYNWIYDEARRFNQVTTNKQCGSYADLYFEVMYEYSALQYHLHSFRSSGNNYAYNEYSILNELNKLNALFGFDQVHHLDYPEIDVPEHPNIPLP